MRPPSASVSARLFGGLGNQLFIYAAARALAGRNKVPLFLDRHSGFEADRKFKRQYLLDKFPISAVCLERRKTYSGFQGQILLRLELWRARLKLPLRSGIVLERQKAFDAAIAGMRVYQPVWLEGYWQSYKYFEDHQDVIRSELKPPADRRDAEIMAHIVERPSVSVHLRRKDIAHKLDADFYTNALNYIRARVPGVRAFCFTDDASEAIALLPPGKNVIYVNVNDEANDPLREFALQASCEHHIIANSTFSWWSAWLGTTELSLTVAPKALPDWGHDGLIPASWMVI